MIASKRINKIKCIVSIIAVEHNTTVQSPNQPGYSRHQVLTNQYPLLSKKIKYCNYLKNHFKVTTRLFTQESLVKKLMINNIITFLIRN